MIKLGIDIVDLNDPLLKKRDEKGLRLIIGEKDSLIAHPQIFWLLWTAKEAIYKCQRKKVDYQPKKIPVSVYQEDQDRFFFNSNGLNGLFEVHHDYILAVCAERLQNISYQVIKSEEIVTSSSIRTAILNLFSAYGLHASLGSDRLGLPIAEPSHALLSVSHHHHYGAFACPKRLLKC